MKKNILLGMLFFSLPIFPQVDRHHIDVAKNLDIFNAVYKQLDMMYVDTLDAHEIISYGIDAMLSALDPYTEYYPEEDLKDFKYLITGKYAGIGSLIHQHLKTGSVVIDQPVAGMPAAEAGLRKGDIILSIDDESMEGKGVKYVSDHLRGDAGSSFILKVRRPSTGKVMKMKITRKLIQTPSVPYFGMRENGIGYVNLSGFNDGCSKDVRRAVIELRSKGMKSLVLDLRGNGGGSEKEAVDIVNFFVPKGELVVENRGKMERSNRKLMTENEPIDTVMPVVVLVNKGSASASEITAGALQDMDRAVIIGTQTYGKGLVQTTTDMPYNSAIKITTNKYYIPSGRCIQAVNYKRGIGGYREQVADSLKRTFLTRHGREVKDGGGIMPDIEIKPDSMTNIVYYLVSAADSSEVVFDYVLDYVQKHPSIGPAKDFELSDADYEEFKQRVLNSTFKYNEETGKYLNQLEELARFEGYYEDAKEEFASLKKKLTHDTERDLDFNKAQLKRYLESDIVAVYYGESGSLECSLKKDKQLAEAERILANPDEYHRILQGSAPPK